MSKATSSRSSICVSNCMTATPLHWLWRSLLAPMLMADRSRSSKSAITRTTAGFGVLHSTSPLDRDFHCYTHRLVFLSPDEELEVAFRRKMDYVVEECRLAPGSQVLEQSAPAGARSRLTRRARKDRG